ncbi:hypothetical protein [Sorangium sp. So ce233]|uniref:hypothetical protein n=1 Tax=Sorangium sp. So ce233 TaxID=3133290 RepID=UPI003F6074F1
MQPMNHGHHHISSLPEIDAVDVLVLDDTMPEKAPSGVTGMYVYILGAADAPHVRVVGTQALHIATLWRRLPPGDEAACHEPPFGLRVHAGDIIALQASVCWMCSNIYGYRGSQQFDAGFDARSAEAQELLSLLEQVTHGLPRPAAY